MMRRCYDALMRTTLNLDDDVLRTARAIARADGRALGDVVSELMRRGLRPIEPRLADEHGFPVFEVSREAAPITDEMVRAALEET
jgi:hypothetical protein